MTRGNGREPARPSSRTARSLRSMRCLSHVVLYSIRIVPLAVQDFPYRQLSSPGGIKPSNSFGAVRSRCLSAAQCQYASLAGYQLHRRGHRFRAHGGILSPDLLIVHYGRWPIRHRLMIERWPGLLDEVPVAPGNHPQPPAVRG